MKKSGISPEDWILITLMNASERTGISLDKWYFIKRPDELEIEHSHFYQIINKMEEDGTIKRASFISGNYCLSDKGKKEAITLKRRLNFNDYYSIISKFPELELKERVQRLEALIIYSAFLVLIINCGKLILQYITNPILSSALLLINIFFLLLISYYSIFNLSNIAFYWVIGLQRETLWRYKEWLWNNKNKFTYPLPAIAIIVIFYVVYIMNIVPWQLIVWGVIMFLITQIAINYNKIVSYIQTKPS